MLVEKGHNLFEVLPDGWVQVSHNSGIHLYLHKNSRVATLSKPYFLGPGSARVSFYKYFILINDELFQIICCELRILGCQYANVAENGWLSIACTQITFCKNGAYKITSCRKWLDAKSFF